MRRVTMFNILGRLSKVISLRSKKKSESYDTPNKLYGRKRNKSLDFEKFTLRIGLVKYRAMVQKSYFLKAKFFSKALRKFSMCRMTMFNILGRLSKVISLRSKKKIRVIRHTNQKISMKTRFTSEKKTVLPDFPSDHCN